MNYAKNISIYLSIFYGLLLSQQVLAGENGVNRLTADQVNENNKQHVMRNKTQPEKNIEEVSGLRNKRKSWSEAFKPSEKINADSVISFPVDI